MRVHVIHAHPVETSFNRALFDAAVTALETAGHEVDALDLYAEDFDACLSRDERVNYLETPANISPQIAPYVERLRAAEALVFVHPVWNYGYPAILKGYFDRVWLPDVAFHIADGKFLPALTNIRKVAFVTTYGGNRLRTMLAGDPPRLLARRWAWTHFRMWLPPKYLALYDMDKIGAAQRKAFLEQVSGVMGKL
jgi:putative NADPH-quinone reductase